MNKTKKGNFSKYYCSFYLSIIVLFIIVIIGLIFYGTKLTKKPAPVVEEKPTKIESLPKIEKIRKFKIADYDKIESFLISSNGQRVGVEYIKNNRHYIQINDKTYGPYDNMRTPFVENASCYQHLCCSDSSVCGWVFITKDGKHYVQIDDKIYGPSAFDFSFSPDGSKVAIIFKEEVASGNEVVEYTRYIKINDKKYGPYDNAGDPVFSNDSSKYGWWFEKYNKYYVQINDKAYGPYDDVYYPVFSSNG